MTTDRERLQSFIQPCHYALSLRELDLEQWTYSGTVVIDSSFSQPTNEIIINLHQIELLSVTAEIWQGQEKTTLHASNFAIFEEQQRAAIHFVESINASSHVTITCEFRAKINEAMTGFYRSKYQIGGDMNGSENDAIPLLRGEDDWAYMLSTHFQPAGARWAFPCFDDPGIKARFDLCLEIPVGLTALSNMPVKQVQTVPEKPGLQLVMFDTTPIMSTYLLVWAIGEFEWIEQFTERSYNGEPIPVRVYTTPGLSAQGHWALDHAVKSIDFFSEIFMIDYPLPKCDLVIVHAASFSAMENWGLITVEPTSLLFDPEKSHPLHKQSIPWTITHEVAHQWFGNLVTLEWWDMLWLNEGFATWAGQLALEKMHPEWNRGIRFINTGMTSAFRLDGMRTSHPIHVPVERGQDASEIFDNISYSKGCAIIQMLSNFLGVDVFLDGVSKYLKHKAYGCATTADLWDALASVSGANIHKIMDAWVSKVGYPVLEISEEFPNSITIRQSRFLDSGDVQPDEDDTIWWIPIGFQDPSGNHNGVVMNTKTMSFHCVDSEFYVLNGGGTGFYRVRYPDARLAKLSQQMERLTTADKLTLLGSQSALALSGSSSIASLLGILESFAMEREPLIWQRILSELEFIRAIFDEDQEIADGLSAYCLKIAQSGLEIFGREKGLEEEEQEDNITDARRKLAALAAHTGDKQLQQEALDIFHEWCKTGDTIEASKRSFAYNAAARYIPDQAFKPLLHEWQHGTASDSKLIALWAISHIQDEAMVRDVLLPFCFDAEPASLVVAAVDMRTLVQGLAGDPKIRYLVWDYMKNNWSAIVEKVNNTSLLNLFLRNTVHRFSSKHMADDIRQFFEAKDVANCRKTVEIVVNLVEARATRRQREMDSVRNWLLTAGYLLGN